MGDFATLFPPTGSKSSRWFPVYLEPIVGSGERFTVAVVAYNSAGHVVERLVPEDKFVCFYGESAFKLLNIISMAVEQLEGSFDHSHSFTPAQPIFEGLYLGESREINLDNLETVVRIASRYVSSLSLADRPAAEQLEVADRGAMERWSTRIRNSVNQRNSSLAKCFNKKIAILEDRTIEYDFVFDRYVANFGFIDYRRLSPTFKSSKSSLVDLEMYRQSNSSMFMPNKYELIVGVPRTNDPYFPNSYLVKFLNTIELIENYAQDQGISIKRVVDADEAAEHILSEVAS